MCPLETKSKRTQAETHVNQRLGSCSKPSTFALDSQARPSTMKTRTQGSILEASLFLMWSDFSHHTCSRTKICSELLLESSLVLWNCLFLCLQCNNFCHLRKDIIIFLGFWHCMWCLIHYSKTIFKNISLNT